MKYLLALPVLLTGCMTIDINCEGGGCNLNQSKNVPITAGQDIRDTGRVEPLAPEVRFETKDFEGNVVPLHINLPSKALDY